MSQDWDVACLDCDVELGISDANHQEEGVQAMARDAAALAELGRVAPHVKINANESYGIYGYGAANAAPVRWFLEHAGHRIVARSEYGNVYGRCNDDVICGECGHRNKCARDEGHGGEHLRKLESASNS